MKDHHRMHIEIQNAVVRNQPEINIVWAVVCGGWIVTGWMNPTERNSPHHPCLPVRERIPNSWLSPPGRILQERTDRALSPRIVGDSARPCAPRRIAEPVRGSRLNFEMIDNGSSSWLLVLLESFKTDALSAIKGRSINGPFAEFDVICVPDKMAVLCVCMCFVVCEEGCRLRSRTACGLAIEILRRVFAITRLRLLLRM